MPANLKGADHDHTVRVREVPSSNLGTPTAVHMGSLNGYPCGLKEVDIQGL